MSAKHTPGPWAHDGEGIVWAVDQQAFGGWIADCRNGAMDQNARLIAAAPELLDALKALCTADFKDKEGGTHGYAIGSRRDRLWEAARELIAKAEAA
jgi:hypothetical protein